MADENDPYDFILHITYISPSQWEILQSMPFVGATQPSPTSNSHLPLSSAAGIVMLSQPDTQDDLSAPHDVFLTPPEGSSLPSSVDVDHCTVNHAADDFIYLETDDELGFSQPQSTPQQIHLADGGSQGDDQFGDLGRSSQKKLKHDLGFGSARDGSGLKLHNVEDGKGKGKLLDADGGDAGNEDDFLKEIPMEEESLGSRANVGKGVIQSENQTGVLNDCLHLPSRSIHGATENEGIELPSGGEGCEEKEIFDAFDALKFLAENNLGGEAEDDLEGVSLLEVAKCPGNTCHRPRLQPDVEYDGLALLKIAKDCGITFPRPRWWPDGNDENFDKLKICEKKH